MSEIIKVRGRLGGIRVGPAFTQHALPELAPDRSVIRRLENSFSSQGRVSPLPVADIDALLAAEYEHGRADGTRNTAAEYESAIEARMAEERKLGEQLSKAIAEQIRQVSERLEREAFKFAVAIAGRIIKKEVTVNDEIVVRQIQEALRRVAGQESIKVRVNPRCEAMVRQNREMLIAGSESVRELVVEIDEKIEPGGCIIETTSGTVDARLLTQLEQIEAALFGQTV